MFSLLLSWSLIVIDIHQVYVYIYIHTGQQKIKEDIELLKEKKERKKYELIFK